MVAQGYGFRLPVLALTSLFSTIILILVGGVVRVTGNGLGCPDWPLCYGQAIPPILHRGEWVEFSHRLVGLVASAQIILLLMLAWRHYRGEKWIFRPALVAAIFLVFQILLGGIHVILEIPPLIGWIHTANAMLIVGLLAVVLAAALLSVEWRPKTLLVLVNRTMFLWLAVVNAVLYLMLFGASYAFSGDANSYCFLGFTCDGIMSVLGNLTAIVSGVLLAVALGNVVMYTSAVASSAGHLLRRRIVGIVIPWIVVAVYVLLLTGSFVTRSGASLACPSFPLCGPAPAGMSVLINIQLLHRYTAYGVSALLLLIVYWLSTIQNSHDVTRFAHGLLAILLLQVNLGAANILLKLPMWSRALHLTVGATLWVTVVIMWVAFVLGPKIIARKQN